MNHIHFLIADAQNSLEELNQSNLASVRLRAFPAAKVMKDHNWRVTVGDDILGRPQKIVITKISPVDIQNRSKKWLMQIRQHKSLGAQIYLDYSDHHLAIKSTVSSFYVDCLKFIDQSIVPSKHMKDLLSFFYKGQIFIIEDPLEITIQPIKSSINRPITLLWFGHSSNIYYLVNFLKTGFDVGDKFKLIVLSNKVGVDIFTNSNKSSLANIQYQTGIWSKDLMLYAATKSDACIIPSDPIDLRKKGASSNRLITALTLGLPVAADNLNSYTEFSDFYVSLRTNEFRFFLNNPEYFHEKTKLAQELIIPRFSMHQIEILWLKALTLA